MSTDGYFEVGVATGAFGLRGEVKVFPLTDDPGRFALLDKLWADGDRSIKEYAKEYKIEGVRIHKNMVLIKFAGVDDASAAMGLRGTVFKIPPELALPLEEGQYYHRDLLDMAVFDEGGTELGVLTKIIPTGANDVYEVNLRAGGSVLLPAIPQCILEVNVSEKKMTVHVLKGLMD